MFFNRLPSFSLRYQSSGRIENVHLFMKCLYRFWYYRGLWGSCLASCVDFLNSLFLFCVIFFFTTLFDWSVALGCEGAACGHAELVHDIHSPTVFGKNHAIIAFVLLFSSFVAACYEFVMFLETCVLHAELRSILSGVVDSGYTTPIHHLLHIWRGLRARAGGHEEIRLCGELTFIGDMSWGGFLDSVCERIQEDRSLGIAAHSEFNSLLAIQALMVYDNYFIALHERGVLEKGSLRFVDDNLLQVLICGMFDEFNSLKPGRDQLALVRAQLIKYLVLYVLFYPFVVMLFLLRVLVKNAAIIRSDWGNYTARDWNNYARWAFRLYNEVPHILSARLSFGRQIAAMMILRMEPCSSLARFVRRTVSTIVFVIVTFSFLNPSLVISGSLGGVSFVTWLYISLIIFSFCSEKTPVYREYNYEADVHELINHIHYKKDEWFYSGDCFYRALTREFMKSRLFLIAADLARTFLMPFILIGILCDGSVQRFVECVSNESVSIDGLGSVARGSTFEQQGVDVTDVSLPVFCFSEKCAKSIASFSSIYTCWALRRMQAFKAKQKEGTETEISSANAIGKFLVQLHDGVNEQNKQPSRKESALRSGPFSATFGETYETTTSLMLRPVWGTAHNRELMFVSEAMNLFMSAESPSRSGYSTHASLVRVAGEDESEKSNLCHTMK